MKQNQRSKRMEEFFIIPNRRLDGANWELSDLCDDYNAMEYCIQLLDIPEEHLEYVTLGNLGLEICLTDLDREDWYTQLRRIANVSRMAS